MKKHLLPLLCLCMFMSSLPGIAASAKMMLPADTVAKLKPEVRQVVETVIKASGTFSIEAVSDLYAPNAVVADEQPPFSWNGQLAGVQWINSVQKAVRILKSEILKLICSALKLFSKRRK
ncbi:hypothetical protein ACFJIV_27335 [Mucilaginibacter sp. UC70_90]